jgi:outer membrane protein TolC
VATLSHPSGNLAHAQTRPAAGAQGAPSGAAPTPAGTPAAASPAAASGAAAASNPGKEPSTEELEKQIRTLLGGTPGGLTAELAATRAAHTSPAVRDKARQLDSFDAKYEATKAAYYPRLTAAARATYLSPVTLPPLGGGGSSVVSQVETPGPVAPGEPLFRAPAFTFPVILEQFEFKASLSVPFSDYLLSLSSALAAASHSRKAVELNQKAEQVAAALTGRQAYYEWVRAQAQYLVTEQSLGELRARYEDAKRSFDVGLVSKADVLRAEAGVKQGELAVTRARLFVNYTTEQLRTVLHDPPGTQYAVGENLLDREVGLDGTDDVAKLQEEARKNRLEVRALDETVYALREGVDVQRAGLYPRLDGSANAYMANPNNRIFPNRRTFDGTWDLSAVLSWTPTEIPGILARVKDTEAQAASIEEKKTQLIDGLRLEVTGAWNQAQEARAALEASTKAYQASAESYRVRRDLYRAGRATLVELTDAQTALTRARIEVVDAQMNGYIARAKLMRALGRDLRNPDGSAMAAGK